MTGEQGSATRELWREKAGSPKFDSFYLHKTMINPKHYERIKKVNGCKYN